MKSEYLAIVPARAGSRRLPGKNFREFGGKPLWKWAWLVGKEACGKVVVTSDRECEDRDARDDWMMRAMPLATDEAPVWWAVEDVCYRLGWFGSVVLLQPTSPFRDMSHMIAAMHCFGGFAADCPGAATVGSMRLLAEPDGGIYIMRWKGWERKSEWGRIHVPCGPDIDTQEDWDRALALVQSGVSTSHHSTT